MTSRIVKTKCDLELLIKFLKEQPLPFTITVAKGRQRTTQQNKLQRLLINEIAEQAEGQTQEEIRGFCKLHLGIPILRAENEAFRLKYDAIIKPLTYEQKLAVMMEPLDFPVTRIMDSSQKTRYIDCIYNFFCEKGMVLTVPKADRK